MFKLNNVLIINFRQFSTLFSRLRLINIENEIDYHCHGLNVSLEV